MSVPLYYSAATATISKSGMASWDAEAQELVVRVCSEVQNTGELLACFERLRILNAQGRMSQIQRGNLIAGIADRRKVDANFRDVVWTVPETSEAYGRLLMS